MTDTPSSDDLSLGALNVSRTSADLSPADAAIAALLPPLLPPSAPPVPRLDGDGPLARGRLLLDATTLRRLRKALVMSQQDLADDCWRRNIRVSIATIKRAEGGHEVRFRTARELARCFEVPIATLLVDRPAARYRSDAGPIRNAIRCGPIVCEWPRENVPAGPTFYSTNAPQAQTQAKEASSMSTHQRKLIVAARDTLVNIAALCSVPVKSLRPDHALADELGLGDVEFRALAKYQRGVGNRLRGDGGKTEINPDDLVDLTVRETLWLSIVRAINIQLEASVIDALIAEAQSELRGVGP
jgi:transcriptional regulator with XRE-family HTH domain